MVVGDIGEETEIDEQKKYGNPYYKIERGQHGCKKPKIAGSGEKWKKPISSCGQTKADRDHDSFLDICPIECSVILISVNETQLKVIHYPKMGIDYYGILQIPRTSTSLDIKKA